jgi:hypothetical protein
VGAQGDTEIGEPRPGQDLVGQVSKEKAGCGDIEAGHRLRRTALHGPEGNLVGKVHDTRAVSRRDRQHQNAIAACRIRPAVVLLRWPIGHAGDLGVVGIAPSPVFLWRERRPLCHARLQGQVVARTQLLDEA